MQNPHSKEFVEEHRLLFGKLRELLFSRQNPEEIVSFQFGGEYSQFLRFSKSRVRHAGEVHDLWMTLSLIQEGRKAWRTISLPYDFEEAIPLLEEGLNGLREDLKQVPKDPFLVMPAENASSEVSLEGSLIPAHQVCDELLPVFDQMDMVGSYAAGPQFRAFASSKGTEHWFSNLSYSFDFSVVHPNTEMVKATVAGANWDGDALDTEVIKAKAFLEKLGKERRIVSPGRYRVYLSSRVVSQVLGLFAWGSFSEREIREGRSPLSRIRDSDDRYASGFSLSSDFSRVPMPRFDVDGHLSSPQLQLFENGKFVNALVSESSAKEYGISSNGALSGEMLTSTYLAPGTLDDAEALKELGTGLYITSFHYLNWSHNASGRITGLTRYACFWVEDGEIVAPVATMRFDESLGNIFGEHLLALGNASVYHPSVDTYGSRVLGGVTCPSVLVDDFAVVS